MIRKLKVAAIGFSLVVLIALQANSQHIFKHKLLQVFGGVYEKLRLRCTARINASNWADFPLGKTL